MYRGLFIFVFLAWFHRIAAQLLPPELFTIEQGLSQGMVYDLLQTRDGFLYAATKDGLNRYDGYHFKVFTHDPFNPYSLSENSVTALFEDSRGWLWVGSDTKGVDLYHPATGLFYHVALSNLEHPPAAGSSYEIIEIKETFDGNIWALRRGGGLFCITIPPQWAQQLPQQPDLSAVARPVLIPLDASAEALIGIEPRDEHTLLLATSARQYILDTRNYACEPVAYFLQKEAVIDVAYCKNKKESDYWLVTPSRLYHHRAGTTQAFRLPPGTPVDRLFIETDQFDNLYVLAGRQMWVLDQDELFDATRPDWEMDQFPTRLTSDRNGNLWVGTLGYGLRLFNPRKKLFHPGAPGNTIWGLWKDAGGRYYAKVVNKVFSYDPQTRQLSKQPAFPKGPTRILDMIPLANGDVWIVGRNEPETDPVLLQRYGPNGALLQTFQCPLKAYTYTRLLMDRSGHIWMTGAGCQLLRIRPEDGRLTEFRYDAALGAAAGAAKVFAIAEDGNGVIWLGTQLGLVKCVPVGNEFRYQWIKTDAAHPKGLTNDVIACLLVDPRDPGGVLWIGTKGGGIHRMDLKTGEMRVITTADGLPNEVVYGILPGRDGELWCSTNRGLAKITLPASGLEGLQIISFSAAKGLQDNEFNTQAFSMAPDGELLFGGVNGLNHFKPWELAPNNSPAPVYLVGLEVNRTPVAFGKGPYAINTPIERLSLLQLDYKDNNLSFEFAALDFTDPQKNRYRYRLEGIDRNWIDAGFDHFAHYTHLPPGRYQFYVQGSNGEGPWQDAATVLRIVIRPPWWRSDAACTAYVLLLGLFVWQIYRFQVRRLRLREQLAFEHREAERIREMEQMKTNFFSNVTHEFRTPLTLMLEPLRQLIQNPADKALPEKLRLVERNSLRLLSLVNQLLDLSKIEHGGMQLQPKMGDLMQTVQSILPAFESLAHAKKIELQYLGGETPLYTLYDPEKVELVLNNLLSNALKFTPEGGRVRLKIQWDAEAEQVQMVVEDNGPGIAAAYVDKIFDRFFQAPDAPVTGGAGTGIGLALSKELAQLMGGDIRVQTRVGAGSVFTFTLPIVALPHAPDATEAPTADMPLALVIDDSEDMRMFLQMSLQGSWRVLAAANGEEGIAQATAALPDVIVSDLVMPGKSGHEVCIALKHSDLTAHIPIILLTAKSNLSDRLQGLAAGADDYLAKPFHTVELKTRMENLLENRRRLKRLFEGVPVLRGEAYEEKPFLSAADNAFLMRFTQIISDHLDDETLGVEEFAAKMYISRVQLHRKLKALTGTSATDFIRNYRLDRAWHMLRQKEGLVSEIATRTGFANEKYFSTVFKEKFGVSPSAV